MKISLPKTWQWLSLALCAIACKQEPHDPAKAQHEPQLPQIMTSPVLGNSSLPHLFVAQDSVYLSWVEKLEDGRHAFQFASTKDTVWSPIDTIATGNNWFVNWADYPTMTQNGDEFLATFLQRSDSGKYTYDVRYTVKKRDSLWRKPKILHDDGIPAEHGFVSLLPYGENFFATWLDGRTTVAENPAERQMTLRAAVINREGHKLEDFLLDDRVCDCCQTAAAMTSTGPIVFYRNRSKDDEEVRDIYYTRAMDTLWTEPKPVFKDNWKINGCPVNGPRADAHGENVAVAWFTMANEKPKVQVSFSKNAAKSFDTPIRVDEGNPLGRVDVVMADEKTAVVSWLESRDNEDVIMAMRVDTDGVRSPAIEVARSSSERSSGFPQMTLLGSTIYFAWTRSIDEQKTVVVAHLDISAFSHQ